MTTDQHPLVLVTGASGKTGRRIVPRLGRRGVAVRAASRSGTPPFDWNDPSTWPAVLDGVTAAYLAYAPDLTIPGAVETIDRFCEAAVGGGVERLVLLSGRGEEEAEAAEAVVRASGARTTIVRASFFAQNFSEDLFLGPVLAGELALPAGDVAEPFVDADDIADVAVAALVDKGHDGRTYDVTGPRLLTFADAADDIAAASGRAVAYRHVEPDDYVAEVVAAGAPAPLAEMLADLFARVLDGRNAHLGDGVAEALGRPPGDFVAYARAVAATGAWDPRPAAVSP